MNVILLLGGLLGLSSVMMAAYVDHVLALHVSGKALSSLLTAQRYHQLYSIVISMMGLYLPLSSHTCRQPWIYRSAYLFILGVVLFSFSIYLSLILSQPSITTLTPFGGILLMLAWLCLILASFKQKNNGI
jgi:uncharacterized membrane protein YgdD (TMEM256/DUF423 family)